MNSHIDRTAVAQFRALSAFSQLPLGSPSYFNWCGRFPWTLIEVESRSSADRRVDRLVAGHSPSAKVSLTQDILYVLHRRRVAAPASRAHADHFNQGLVSSRPLGFGVNSTAPMLVCLKCGTIHRGAPGSIDTVC